MGDVRLESSTADRYHNKCSHVFVSIDEGVASLYPQYTTAIEFCNLKKVAMKRLQFNFKCEPSDRNVSELYGICHN